MREIKHSMKEKPIPPWDYIAIAKMLREEASNADQWAKSHADGASVNAKGIRKRDVYRQKANAYRKAAKALETLL